MIRKLHSGEGARQAELPSQFVQFWVLTQGPGSFAKPKLVSVTEVSRRRNYPSQQCLLLEEDCLGCITHGEETRCTIMKPTN